MGINCDKDCPLFESQLSQQCYNREIIVCDIKSTQAGSVMKTFNYVQTPSTNSTMLNQRCKDYKEGGKRTWAYSH